MEVSNYDPVPWLMEHMDRKHTKGRKRGATRKRLYINMPCAFDIETSRACVDADGNPHTIMYIWQCQMGLDVTIIGRTWDEWIEFTDKINRYLQQNSGPHGDWFCVMYVHNLAHEFQYLSGVLDFGPADVFASKPRRVLKCDNGAIEYRCSMRHSNLSLDAWGKQLGAPHAKLTGSLDYTKVRYPWTPLTETEIAYCVNDVRCVVECLMIEMQRDGDDLYTIPLTRTGYVRRMARGAIYEWGIKRAKKLLPDWALYQMLREAFREGDTHANRYYVGLHLENVGSVDMSSAYPAVQCECYFPMTPFRAQFPSVNQLMTCMRHGKACLMRLRIKGLRQRYSWWGFPYIPLAKTRHCTGFVNDNGRLLSAEYLEMTITDIDFRIIAKEYDWDALSVLDLYSADYGKLPAPLLDRVKESFTGKTALKGVKGQELYYVKSKNDLNSYYGMTAQDPLQLDTLFDEDNPDGLWEECADDPEGSYKEHMPHLFLPYQWGVWTTAHTRKRLKIAQWAAGKNGVYCDTDSVKYLGDIDLTDFNKAVKQLATENGACAKDPKGIMHYMGVYEQEKSYAEFMTWGAKKYATTYKKGGLITTTIAGVSKQKGGLELSLWGGFAAFKPGFTFCLAAGNQVIYNDRPELSDFIVDGHTVHITRNLCICDNTYTLGITDEYARILGYKIMEVV